MDERAGKTIIKTFSLYPEDIYVINQVNDMLGLRASSSDALRYILQDWRLSNSHYFKDEPLPNDLFTEKREEGSV